MYAVVEEQCDICGHECVSVMPLEFLEDGTGAECGECGNMSMYPREKESEPWQR